MTTDFECTTARRVAIINEALTRYLAVGDALSQQTADAMRYSVENGGKRIRPVLMMEFYTLFGGDEKDIAALASALEMIHCSSLVHDDLPCMDDSDLRRGKPSTHKQYGEWQALLAGDGLLLFAFETAARQTDCAKIKPEGLVKALGELAAAAGISGMVGGQNADLESETRRLSLDELKRMQTGKTGALIAASGRIAAAAAGVSGERAALADTYCFALGRAFQVVDDLLDATGDAGLLGKPVGADQTAGKSTFVTELGLTAAREYAAALTDEATAAADALGSPFLRQLAGQMLSRKF